MNFEPIIYIVDDDDPVRDSFRLILETSKIACQAFASAKQFLQSCPPEPYGCLLLDVNMPEMNGPELQAELKARNIHLPILFLTGYGSIPLTVKTIQAGAVDFLTKPVRAKELVARIQQVLTQEAQRYQENTQVPAEAVSLATLTSREREILQLVIQGLPNKLIARQLDISHRTVESHRIRILQKTGVANFLELAHLYDPSQFSVKTDDNLSQPDDDL